MNVIADHMSRHPLTTSGALQEAGVTRSMLAVALKRGEVVRQAQGVYCSEAALGDGMLEYAAASLATGGIVCGGTAGMHHGLTDEAPPEILMLVPTAHAKGGTLASIPVRKVRSEIAESFTLGIEEIEVLGVTVRITGKARTVVDLFRLGSRQHAVAALHAYLADGGTGDEIRRMAEPFGTWTKLSPVVEMAMEGVTRAPVP